MDTMDTLHIQIYCNQIRLTWEASEAAKSGKAPEVHVERREAWALWIDEPSILATEGQLAWNDCSDVIRRLTGWPKERTGRFMQEVEQGEPRVFSPIFDHLD